MSQDNIQQLEDELVATEADAESQDLLNLQNESTTEQLNQITNRALEQLQENRNEAQEDIDGIKADIILPKWSISPKVILAAASVIKPESTVMNITATVGGGAVTMTSNPSIADGINGQVLVLRGSHATDTITLTDGNGMQLNGNTTLAINDTLTLYYDGLITKDWIEICRSKVSTDLTTLASGVYTPTRSAEVNLDANVTMTEAQYLRVGSTVTVSGRFTANPTAGGTASFEITLPVASNLGAPEDAAGVAFCGTIASQGAAIIAVAANNTAQIAWIAVDTTSQLWSYTFSYQII